MNTLFQRTAQKCFSVSPASRTFSSASVILKQRMETVIADRQQEVMAFKKEHANTVIGEVDVSQIIGGMRGIPGMLYETSKLDPAEGISYRGTPLFDIVKNAPKTIEGG